MLLTYLEICVIVKVSVDTRFMYDICYNEIKETLIQSGGE